MKINLNYVRRATASWRELNKVARKLNEHEAARALELERTGKHRKTLVVRLHKRLTRLRARRERSELRAER